MNQWLEHLGTPHEGMTPHSGRFPYGSGEHGFQRVTDQYSYIRKLKKDGLTEKEIADSLGISTDKLRSIITTGKNELAKENMVKALEMRRQGKTLKEISEQLDVTDGTVRNYLKNAEIGRVNKQDMVADALREAVNEIGYIDVGVGCERYFDMSQTTFRAVCRKLEEEGYSYVTVKAPQVMTGEKTTIKVLAPPGTTWQDVQNNLDQINLAPGFYVENDKIEPVKPPISIDSNRLMIRYAEEGGVDRDGVIEIRRGVSDLDMGAARYCQARIAVDGTHYLKGMVMYADDLPDGIDIRFNTNKHLGTPVMDQDPKADQVLKPMKDDPDNPFGAIVRQIKDPATNEVTSAINLVRAEGDWDDWSRNLSSQFLSKQSKDLIKTQLGLAYDDKRGEFNEIMAITEPTVRKYLLDKFADQCDSDAVELKAAAMPRQITAVLLPTPSVSPSEVYDPNHENGESVVLIRYPHAGTFEIPRLTVNNKNPEAKALIQNAKDAVGIHPSVAQQLSGADFDGDFVVVIPDNEGRIEVGKMQEKLQEFDPKIYKMSRDSKGDYPYEMSDSTKGNQMGRVSNLITDMTLQGASMDDVILAVKHSMVVIDAQKHHLDYKQSYKDHDIARLEREYQWSGDPNERPGGAATLISRAKSELTLPIRKEKHLSDMTPEEKERYNRGEVIWDYDLKDKDKYMNLPVLKSKKDMTPEEKEASKLGAKIYERDENGKIKRELVERTTKSTKAAEASDLRELSSGTLQEEYYADYGNKMKALGNEARKALRTTEPTPYSSSAFSTYRQEVASLVAKLNEAEKNAPLERRAQLIANAKVSLKIKDNPSLKLDDNKDDLKKLKTMELGRARDLVGAKKKDKLIQITPREWEAIQAGAIHTTTLTSILRNTDLNVVRNYATPKTMTSMSPAKEARARAMINSGRYTQSEVARALGVSVSTIQRVVQ